MKLKIYPSLIKNNTTLQISGHKHSFVQIISAAIILNKKCVIKNVPNTDDTIIFIQLIQQLGGTAKYQDHIFYFNPTDMRLHRPNTRLCKKIHGAMYFLFALAIRFGKFYTLPTGGCQIGANGVRPDSHLLPILSKFGQIVQVNADEYTFTPYTNKKIQQNIKHFSDSIWFLSGEQVSSATKLCILAALGCTNSLTTIRNYYFRTDVADLLDFIELAGIKITKRKNKLSILSVPSPSNNLLTFVLSDCQSEIITFIAFAVMQNINLTLKIKSPQRTHDILDSELNALYKMGIKINFKGNNIFVYGRNTDIKPLNLLIKHTGIQSDHQPFFALMLTRANGKSMITEHVWKNRFKYTEELNKLGFDIQQRKNQIVINPNKNISSISPVITASDTRAAAVLTIAATTKQQPICICNAEHLMRGYDKFIEKLQQTGSKIIS